MSGTTGGVAGPGSKNDKYIFDPATPWDDPERPGFGPSMGDWRAPDNSYVPHVGGIPSPDPTPDPSPSPKPWIPRIEPSGGSGGGTFGATAGSRVRPLEDLMQKLLRSRVRRHL